MDNLEKLIADLNKKSKNSVRFGEPDFTDIPRIPMNNVNLEYLFRGGLPENIMYELYGNPSCGKSLLAYSMLAEWQKKEENKERKAVIFDYETSHTDKWATTLGVDMNKVIIWQPMNNESAEELFDIIIQFADTGEIGFMILDSVGSLVPKARKNKDSFEEKIMGGIAAPLTDFVNEFNSRRTKYGITFVAINQIREDFQNQYSKGNSPGGKAFKHHCGIRLVLSACEYFDYKGNTCSQYSDAAGHHIAIVVEKNKVTTNDRKRTTITFRYTSGIDNFRDNIDFAVLHGFIKGSGAWYEIVDYTTGEVLPKKLNGMKQVYEFYKTNEDQYISLYNKLREFVKEENDGI